MSFWRGKSNSEVMRQNQRALRKITRELDRERGQLERQEKKLIADIKKMGKTGQMGAVKIMAKDIVRTRNYIKKFYSMRANIQAITLKLQTMQSQLAMAKAMKGVTKAMTRMNSQMKLPQLQKIMMEFERESEIMDMKDEMMSDTIDDVIGGEEEEEEGEAIVEQLFDELGLQWDSELARAVPMSGVKDSESQLRKQTTVDIENRLEELRNP